MYSERKSIALKNAIVTVDIERHNDVEIFTRHIQLLGDLDDQQRERLLEIAQRCPIHKALAGEVQIKTQLVN
jgi:putative redox protein